MFLNDPLSTREDDKVPGGGGTSPWLAIAWFVCIPLGIYACVQVSPEKERVVMLLPGEVQLTPEIVASYRALPPQQQLYRVSVDPLGTEAIVSCETLEPLKCQIRYGSSLAAEVTTLFPDLRPRRLHVMSIENLKPNTDYRYVITSLEQDTGIPRASRSGGFRTLSSDDPTPLKLPYTKPVRTSSPPVPNSSSVSKSSSVPISSSVPNPSSAPISSSVPNSASVPISSWVPNSSSAPTPGSAASPGGVSPSSSVSDRSSEPSPLSTR